MKVLRRAIVLLLAAAMLIGAFPEGSVRAATKPGKPVITVETLKNGTDVKITIKETTGAKGYKIMMKAADEIIYKKVKVLKKDGTAVRTYTVKNLAAGEYSFKVKAYTKSGSKTIYGSYSKVKSVTVGKQASGGTVSDFSKAKTGDYITFGSYEQDNDLTNGKEPIEWLVLSNNGEELYVVSRYALDCKPYNEEYTDVTWETCTLRKWLNDDFYMVAFSKTERSAIKTTTVKNADNPKYGTEGGNDTKDKVFLPSIADMVNTDYGFTSEYWPDDLNDCMNRRCAPTAYAVVQGAWVYTGTDATYQTKSGEGACYWWLRSPGYAADVAARVDGNGYVGYSGGFVDIDNDAVRPALIINLNP